MTWSRGHKDITKRLPGVGGQFRCCPLAFSTPSPLTRIHTWNQKVRFNFSVVYERQMRKLYWFYPNTWHRDPTSWLAGWGLPWSRRRRCSSPSPACSPATWFQGKLFQNGTCFLARSLTRTVLARERRMSWFWNWKLIWILDLDLVVRHLPHHHHHIGDGILHLENAFVSILPSSLSSSWSWSKSIIIISITICTIIIEPQPQSQWCRHRGWSTAGAEQRRLRLQRPPSGDRYNAMDHPLFVVLMLLSAFLLILVLSFFKSN